MAKVGGVWISIGSIMCGIVGIWKKDARVEPGELAELRDSLAHRGPDAADAYIDIGANLGLGHRRLSILDLSAAGSQPMRTPDGRIHIVLNGEIYNFRELRAEAEGWGYRFVSHTDTEVVLAFYERHGIASLERLRGMFALAIWDTRRGVLHLVRDRVGIKPLYYYWDGRTFAFASESRAFQTLPCFDRSLDVSALYDYFTYQYIPSPKSIFARVRKLEAGGRLEFEPSALRLDLRRYWTLPELGLEEQSDADVTARVDGLLEDAVRSHLVSDVPVGAFLSGGLDSSTVVALASRYISGLSAFTVDFDVRSRSEGEDAAKLAGHLGLDHRIVTMPGEEFARLAEKFAEIYDEPFGDTSGLPTLAVSALARSSVKVALSGDGGDEVFGGYVPIYRNLICDDPGMPLLSGMAGRALYGLPTKLGARMLQRNLRHGDRVRESPVFLRSGQKRLFFSRSLLGDHGLGSDYDDTWYFRRDLSTAADPIRQRMLLDFHTWLPEKMLTKVDRASMANSLEVRVPLLDHPLVEYMFSLPTRFHWNAVDGPKWVLRRVLDSHVPPEVTRRPKRGFSIPIHEWTGAHRGYMNERIMESRLMREGIFSRGRLRFADTRSPLTRWLLLNAAVWSDRYKWTL